MKRIFWAIQQLDRIGGTETVSIELMNKLVEDYEIVLLSTSANPDPYVYNLNEKIEVRSLEIPAELGRFDQVFSELKGHPFKRFLLVRKLIKHYFWKRGHYQRQIEKMMDRPDDIYIGSSLDSYLLAPKRKGKVIFHYHFDEKSFLDKTFQSALAHSRKPDNFVFLSSSCLDAIVKAKPKLASKSVYIYNPIRFDRRYSEPPYQGKILFVGRYSEQKDPFFALEIMRELKGKPYHLDMYGDGHLKDEMLRFQKENNLDNVEIHDGKMLPKETFQNSDLLLLTSVYEGFCLVKGEATVNSLPTISTRWVGPIEEVFENEKDGMIIEGEDPKLFAEAIDSILSDQKKELALRKSTFASSLRFDDSTIIDKWKELLGPSSEK